MLKEFSCHRISRRWPFVLLTHVLNVSALNAYLLYKKKFPNSSLTRLNFLKKLGNELVKPAIKTRAKPLRTGIPTLVQAAMTAVIGSCHDRFKLKTPPLQEQGKEIGVHYAQGRKILNTVLSVHYALHSFALNIQNPM